MIKNFLSMFRQTPEQLAQQQLDHAHTKALIHTAQAEYHQAQAEMFTKRMSRLMMPTTTPEAPQ